MTLRIAVVGTGYLGAVHAACMADLGHSVVGIDTDVNKIEALSQGRAPFFEPGLPELLARTNGAGNLTWSTDVDAAAEADVVFICVGTPQQSGSYAANTDYVFSAFAAVAKVMKSGALLVGKSTVPVGTVRQLQEVVAREVRAGVEPKLAWNPEFLREGFAVQDTLRPDRFVYGVEGEFAGGAVDLLDEVYARALSEGTPRLVTNWATAELVKVAANSFLATKISFINAMAEICEETGGDVVQLADAIGHDDRIGRKFLGAGVGFGGGCLPKDIRAFLARAQEIGRADSVSFLEDVDAVNLRRRAKVVEWVHLMAGPAESTKVAVLGAAFKPNSDDIRDSPALDVAERLAAQGYDVAVHDPEALEVARATRPGPRYVDEIDAALEDAHIVVHLTEWKQYRELDPQRVAELVATPRLIDGRNVLDLAAWQDAGFEVAALGRSLG